MKPRFKLRLDGSYLPLSPKDRACYFVLQQSKEPLGLGYGLVASQRIGNRPEEQVRRQIVRAYGLVKEFLRVSGLKPHILSEALKCRDRRIRDCEMASVRRALGLDQEAKA